MPSESVLSELQPIGINELSRRLGVDPFEAMRLLLATGFDLKKPLTFPPALVHELRQRGGVDESWWTGVKLAPGGRARVAEALQMLLDRGLVGARTTRMDNVWRGLPFDEQALLQRALTTLTGEGLLVCVGAPTGLQIAVEASKKAQVEGIAKGSASTAGLDALFGG